MDCNKDEATRAKEMAKNKMENNDFEGARKIAQKAQSIYPELESISQLLAVCDVHCSSLKRAMGSEKDWYEILQVERFADELTVKKQYRKLALFLHPDKNRYPGAEAAFKLICEANAVLSDSAKKSLYDNKIRISIRAASVYNPIQNKTKNNKFNPSQRPQSNSLNGFSKLNQQAAGSSSSFSSEKFWTACPFCSIRYLYKREVVNASVRCQSCRKGFIAYETSVQSASMGPKWGQYVPQQPASELNSRRPDGFQEKGVPNQVNETKSVPINGVSASNADTRDHSPRNTVKQDQEINRGSHSGYFRASNTSNGETTFRKTQNLKNRGVKRGRKRVVESSESFDSSVESNIEVSTDVNELNSESKRDHYPRRSTRKRQSIVYHESDDDFDPFPTESPAGKLPKDCGKEPSVNLAGEDSVTGIQSSFAAGAYSSDPKGKQKETVPTEGSFQGKVAAAKEDNVKRETNGVRDFIDDAIEIKSDSDQDLSLDISDEDKCDCPDPEFSNFDYGREECHFAVNQVWACYDDTDRMPRFYAKVKKIHKSPFELCFTWFEADSKDETVKKCVNEKLPVGCGSYKLGATENTDCLLSFSHQMDAEKGQRRGSFIVYPKRGEIWAIFKDWDISLNSGQEKHQFRYEIVEVLSDFIPGTGINIICLDKITGFVSLFQRSNHSETEFILMGPSELYKFSHRVPFFKMTGLEREGVPKGSFELDPASLPLNSDDLYYPGKATNKGHGNLNSVTNCRQNQQNN